MPDFIARVTKAFQPLYIFSVLALLFGVALHTIVAGDLKAEVDTVLTTAIGGLLTLMGTVVNAEFNAAKRDQATRAADTTPPPTNGVTGGPSAAGVP